MAKNKKKKRKLNKKRFLKFIVVVFIMSLFTYFVSYTKITNIYIKGNNYLTDQEIIDISKLKNYPISIKNTCNKIEKRLENNTYIKSVKVTKNIYLNKVYVEIEENYPLFYYESENKTILHNGRKIDDKLNTPVLINYIEQDIYNKLIEKLRKIDLDILNRISEIEYIEDKENVKKFLLFMNDGNYVYVDFKNFETLNKYVDIINTFGDKKGILNLDSGKNFEVFK